LPAPFTGDAVRLVASRIHRAQDILERRIAIENASYYVAPAIAEMGEIAFIRAVLEEADCDLRLDVNNVYVNSVNFAFNLVPPDIGWQIATWSELIGPVALVRSLGTRFASVSLTTLTVVAWASVHADNGYKLPLIYLIMFLPLLLSGPGNLSLDHWIARRVAA